MCALPATGARSSTLDANTDQMRLALELSGTGLWSWDVASGAVSLSEQGCRPARLDHPVAQVRDFLRLVHREDRLALQQAIAQAAESGQSLVQQFRLVAADGAVVKLLMSGRHVAAATPQAAVLYGTLVEVAQEPAAPGSQPDAGVLAQVAVSQLPTAATFVVDRQLRYVTVEGPALQAAGLHGSHFMGRTLPEMLPTQALADHEADYRRALAGGTFRREHRVAERHFVTHGVPLRGRHEQVWAALAFSRDITEYKQAQQALQRSEALLSAVLDALPVGVIIADAGGRIVRDNAANRRIWGVPPETVSWEQYAAWEGYWSDSGRCIQAHE